MLAPAALPLLLLRLHLPCQPAVGKVCRNSKDSQHSTVGKKPYFVAGYLQQDLVWLLISYK
jgi:hypothetical protein